MILKRELGDEVFFIPGCALIWSFFVSPAIHSAFASPHIAPLSFLSLATIIAVPVLLAQRRSGWAFAMTSLPIVLTAASIDLGLFPRVILSSLNPAWSLTIDNMSSSLYKLTVMSWLALTLLPFVLAFEGWSYWVFRKRLDPRAPPHSTRASSGTFAPCVSM